MRPAGEVRSTLRVPVADGGSSKKIIGRTTATVGCGRSDQQRRMLHVVTHLDLFRPSISVVTCWFPVRHTSQQPYRVMDEPRSQNKAGAPSKNPCVQICASRTCNMRVRTQNMREKRGTHCSTSYPVVYNWYLIDKSTKVILDGFEAEHVTG